jgi:hypothetical protein
MYSLKTSDGAAIAATTGLFEIALFKPAIESTTPAYGY